MAVVQKRNFTRSKNELVKLKEVIEGVKAKSITDDNYEGVKTLFKAFTSKLKTYETRRNDLEAVAQDEDLDVLIPKESEDLYDYLSLCLLDIDSSLIQHQVVKRKEKEEYEDEERRRREEREDRKEQEEREERREREEREGRIRLQELEIRRLEVEKICGNSGGSDNGLVKHSYSHLPKIELVRFSGKIEEYQGFWDNFQSLIDSRPDLDDNVKFHYLKNQLTGDAASLIAGIRITNENYAVAVQILKDEYGSPRLVTTKLFSEIQHMRARSGRTNDVHELYRQLEIKLKMLDNQGVNIENEILSSTLFKKLPFKIQQDMVSQKKSDFISTQDIRDRMRDELRSDRLLKAMNPELCYSPPHSPQKAHTPPENTYEPPQSYTTEALYSKTYIRSGKRYNIICAYCGEDHYSDQCAKYATIPQRKERLKDNCHICLKSDHFASECSADFPCYHCKKRRAHHRSLCDKFSRTDNNWRDNDKSNNENKDEPCTSRVLSALSQVKKSVVFMQTACIQVHSKVSNKIFKIRALFDTASSHSFITSQLYEQLKLENKECGELNIFTFGSTSPNKLKVAQTEIDVLCDGNKKKTLDVFVVPNIVGGRNLKNFDKSFLRELNKKYQLCDEYLLQDNLKEIDLLIGIDYYTQFVSGKRIDLEDNLCLWETLFGNVLSGTKYITVDHSDGQENNVNSVLFVDVHFRQDLSESLPRFWDLQTLGIKDPHDVSNDDLALQQFDSTVQFENNRYAVTFPWKNSDRIVQSNYGLALGQLKSVIKRHANDGILEACKQTFDDQLAKGILEIVEDEKGDNKLVHYFPYHAVLRESSSTTKIRLVMNASARQNKSKPSLNDLLYRGPVLLENLGSLLLRFRLNRYALIADIEKAFLNIALQESERDFTRILWVKDPTQPIERENLIILRHTRVPFGVKSSPFLLARVIDTHLSKYDGKFINKLKRDIYVDNIITGVDYECEIQDFVETARKVFNEASLNLREWATNCPNDYYKNMDKTLINTQENQSVLGMNWNVHKDDLSLKFEYHYNNEKVCKRLLLSVYASFFDILGLWCPITTTLKLLIQKTWICKLGWEDEIEDEDKTDFFRIINCMNSVGNIPVGRYLHASLSCDTNYELHAFSDATKDSYAGCVYLKSVSGNETNVNLVFAKSRIAPVKRPTLPRLELLGALIAYRSLKYVHESLDLKITNTYLWIDNQCVIHWIKGTKTLPTFINNRVKEIKSSTFPIIFRYIPTFCNPADIACRGSLKLENCELWWKGPPFLSLATEQWPEFPIDSEQEKFEDLAEDITLVSKHVPNTNENEIRKPVPINEEKFTSFHKLINVTCYVLKFINIKCKKINSYGHITGEEYKNGKEMWIKYIQHVSFSSTIDQLKAGSRDLLALQMGLELNEVNILVSKGRFREIQFRKGESFPVLLPRKCHITTIIINDIHRQCFHSGVSQTLSVLRVEYWIPQGRSTVKTVLNNCVVCKKFKHGSYKSPEFSFLPSYRVNQAIAFTYTAIDYFGPMTITEDKVHKTVWGLIFTCLTTRAVHLELVDSEATTDLILAFRRFIARRGKCKLLLTDNASQFKLLQDVLSSIYSSNELNDYLNREKIIHRYSHPLSPWEGGVYERLISIVKQCLRKSLGNILLTRTQLHTLLVEIESVMNSRPLGYVSEEDFMITPRHFLELKGDMLSQEETYDPIRGKTATFRNVIQLWKKGTSYLDVFWRHWSRSYLDSLKDRRQVMFKQGKTTNIEPREGEVVLIREDKMPRASWPYGVIVKLNPSRDSRVRTAIVRTAHRTEIVRPISMLYPLEY
ncbi:hypothetical protein M8J77_004376 [Diaphorina citri]|nr:hypothetical protein M8J77_004376 [Diaphorina citri]